MTQPQLDLSPAEIDRIISFLGYGRLSAPILSAPIWFIGIEEGLEGMNLEEAAKNLKVRAGFGDTMDLYQAHLRLTTRGQRIDIRRNPPKTQVWRWMAKIMRAYHGCENYCDSAAAKKYVQSKLGRADGETFMTELSPIPSGSAGDNTWRNWFEQREPALEFKIKRRNFELKRRLTENPHSLVICYGHGTNGERAAEFAKFLDVEWSPVSQGICRSGDSRRLLLPFFGQGQMKCSVLEALVQSGLLRKLRIDSAG